MLLGVLSDRYGRELESGRLALERRDNEVVVRYHDDVFPVSPASLDGIEVDSVVRDLDSIELAYFRRTSAHEWAAVDRTGGPLDAAFDGLRSESRHRGLQLERTTSLLRRGDLVR